MKLLILGSTGGTGRHLVQQALEAGHEVTAYARSADGSSTHHARLHLRQGDVLDVTALTDATQGQDAVISALGRGMSFKSEHLIERSVPNILAAMRSTGVRRLLFTSGIGVSETRHDVPLFGKLFANIMLKDIYGDKRAGEQLIRNSNDLEWTIVEPTQLTDGPLTKQYRSGERLSFPALFMPKISRADAAHFILDHLNDRASIRKTLIVSG